MGRLRRSGAGQRADISFEYAQAWLAERASFTLDPSLNLIEGEQRRAGGGLHGIFSDAAPDTWGRRILQRRELIRARDEHRAPRTLDEWDLLAGVNDATRMGALRLARPSDGVFVDDDALAVPPLTALRELEGIALRVDSEAPAGDWDVRHWLERLVAPGASLGGTRPKVTFRGLDGSLWIAKFPAATDVRDIGAWEYVQNRLAARAGVRVPSTELLAFGARYHTFAAQRFDRAAAARRLFASAMTLLEERDASEGVGYLDIASAIERNGNASGRAIEADLEELFRRVVFNALAGHRDDHLRNHGFIHDGVGWRIAPAFDLNPIPDKHEHELNFDGTTTLPDLQAIRSTARLYRVSTTRADAIVADVSSAVATWREVARAAELSRDEIALMAPAYTIRT